MSHNSLQDILKEYSQYFTWMKEGTRYPYQKRIVYGAFLFNHNRYSRSFNWLPTLPKTRVGRKIEELSQEMINKETTILGQKLNDSWKHENKLRQSDAAERERFVESEVQLERVFRSEKLLNDILSRLKEYVYSISEQNLFVFSKSDFSGLRAHVQLTLNLIPIDFNVDLDNKMEKAKRKGDPVRSVLQHRIGKRDKKWVGHMVILEYISRAHKRNREGGLSDDLLDRACESLAGELNQLAHTPGDGDIAQIINELSEKSNERTRDDNPSYDLHKKELKTLARQALKDADDLDFIFSCLLEDIMLDEYVLLLMYGLCLLYKCKNQGAASPLVDTFNNKLIEIAQSIDTVEIKEYQEYWSEILSNALV